MALRSGLPAEVRRWQIHRRSDESGIGSFAKALTALILRYFPTVFRPLAVRRWFLDTHAMLL